MAHVRNMGHMKDTIPELNADMSLKDFMTQHVKLLAWSVPRTRLVDACI